jgi:hypothetical protein
MRGVILVAILGLAACTDTEDETPQVFELSAAAVVRAMYPGIDAPPVANCIVDNATAEEIDVIATTISEGDSQRFDVVRTVLARDETQTCIELANVTFPERT